MISLNHTEKRYKTWIIIKYKLKASKSSRGISIGPMISLQFHLQALLKVLIKTSLCDGDKQNNKKEIGGFLRGVNEIIMQKT